MAPGASKRPVLRKKKAASSLPSAFGLLSVVAAVAAVGAAYVALPQLLNVRKEDGERAGKGERKASREREGE